MAKRNVEIRLPKPDPEILASLNIEVGHQVILRNIQGEEGTVATVEKVVRDANNKPITINVFCEKTVRDMLYKACPATNGER